MNIVKQDQLLGTATIFTQGPSRLGKQGGAHRGELEVLRWKCLHDCPVQQADFLPFCEVAVKSLHLRMVELKGGITTS